MTHHGPQSDLIMGVGNGGYSSAITNGYSADYVAGGTKPVTFTSSSPTSAVSPHYVQDSCVTCHVLENTNATAGEQSSHGMYLVTASGDNVATCQYCHAAPSTTNIGIANSAFPFISGATTFASAIQDGTGPTPLFTNIYKDYATLLAYFANKGNFMSGVATLTFNASTGKTTTTYAATCSPAATNGPVVPQSSGLTAPSGTLTDLSNRLHDVWEYSGIDGTAVAANTSGTQNVFFLSQAQLQALQNLNIFAEDKSMGVHNPMYAAQLLFDACQLLGQTSNWGTGASSRPN